MSRHAFAIILILASALALPLAHAAIQLCDNPIDYSYNCYDNSPGDTPPSGPYVPVTIQRHVNFFSSLGVSKPDMYAQSGTQPLTYYTTVHEYGGDALELNPCAYSGRIVTMGADDQGEITISSPAGTSTVKRIDGKSYDNQNVPATGTFDPQSADVYWWNRNRGNTPMGLGADVEISYRSQNGYTWTGSACVKDTNITGIRVSDTTPDENQVVTLWCKSTVPNIGTIKPTSNRTGVSFTPGDWTDDEQSFTFNVGAPGHQNITCRIGEDNTTARNLTIVIAALPAGELGTSGLSWCDGGMPTMNLSWKSIANAASYNVSVNGTVGLAIVPQAEGTLNRSFSATAISPSDIVVGRTYNWTVTALDAGGAPIKQQNATVAYASCALPPGTFEVPGAFKRAHFERVGNRNLTAFWTDRDVIIVYQNFVTPFDTLAPQSATYSLAGGNRQIVRFDAADNSEAGAFWEQYVRGLRIDSSVAGTPVGLALQSAKGYDPATETYSLTDARHGQYLVLYGKFSAAGNKVYINTVEVAPDEESGSRIDIPLADTVPTGDVQVVVDAAGTRTNALPFKILD